MIHHFHYYLFINIIQVRALEREVSDLQSEFQMDRSDYLESIRRLEKNLKFYQQLIEKAVPVLRKEGRYWDPDAIKANSSWSDDLDKWKLPEDAMTRLKLPPAGMLHIQITDEMAYIYIHKTILLFC